MHRFDVHRIFYGHKSEITNYQVRVYGSPRIKAIGTKDLDQERAQAAFVLALAEAFDPSTRDFRNVVFYVSENTRTWVLSQIKDMAESLTKRIKKEMSEPERKEQGQKILRLLRQWIAHLHVGSGDWPATPPAHWAAFGFTESDPIPSWLKRTLG